MSRTIIGVEGLGKEYAIGGRERCNETLREALTSCFSAPLRRLRRLSGNVADEERIWALKDVSFEVKEGDVVGIIGRNGAGKSTLLKILSRITEPTEGRIHIRGRVASLLEVGTGFHPELTGRENVFLNGAILGMSRAEIEMKFDEIVAFAEITRFLDTPVKRYSSGMYVRLAFAVAAHLEPEILVVDEVLAVGDAAFQKKCLNKMNEVSGKGRTVIFVSHNHHAIRALCSRAILLANGQVVENGPVGTVLEAYRQSLHLSEFNERTEIANSNMRRGDGAVRFLTIKVTDDNRREKSTFFSRETVLIEMNYKVFEPVIQLHFSIGLFVEAGKAFITSIYGVVSDSPLGPSEEGRIVVELPNVNLRPGEYGWYFWLGRDSSVPYDVVDDLIPPITITTGEGVDLLGFNPANPIGYFDLDANIRCYRGMKQPCVPA